MNVVFYAAVESSILMNRRTTWSDEIFGPLVKSDRWRVCFHRDRLGYGLICTYQDILIVSGDNVGGAEFLDSEVGHMRTPSNPTRPKCVWTMSFPLAPLIQYCLPQSSEIWCLKG
jgi:hypothetical protein